jgi:putative MATE family efflux protein
VDRSERAANRILEGHVSLGVLRFGLPLVVGMILHTTFNLIDMFMISRLDESTAAIAALGICDMVAAVATILSNGIATAAVAIIARRVGAKDREGVGRATYQSMLLVGALSVVFGLVGVFGSDFVIRVMMQAKGEAADIAVGYLSIILGGCFSIFFLLQITAVLRALGHAKTAASLLVGGNILNIFLNVPLIYGQGPYPDIFAWGQPIAVAFDIPRLGVEGAAWATLIGRTVPVILGVVILARRRRKVPFVLSSLAPDWRELRNLFRVGWPSSAQLVLRILAVLVFISLVNAIYTTPEDQSALTAYGICLRLETMALFIGMGWGAAASSFVAMNLGAGDASRARDAGWYAALYNFVLMLFLVWLYLAHSDTIVGFFDDGETTLAVGREYFRTVGLTYGLVGVAVVLSQAINGAGATLSSLLVDALVLMVLIPVAIYAAEILRIARPHFWMLIALGNVVTAIGYIGWYARGTFLQKQV